MATVFDVAAFVLQERGRMTAMKLQKLVFYAQAMSLAQRGVPLFSERIEAWSDGPVVRDLFNHMKGKLNVAGSSQGDVSALTVDDQANVLRTLERYGHMTGEQLSHRTHEEDPWLDARKGLGPNQRGDREITHEAMRHFYSLEEAAQNNRLVRAIQRMTPEDDAFYAELVRLDIEDDLSAGKP